MCCWHVLGYIFAKINFRSCLANLLISNNNNNNNNKDNESNDNQEWIIYHLVYFIIDKYHQQYNAKQKNRGPHMLRKWIWNMNACLDFGSDHQ